ncbi:MAG: hypothetical protein LLF76_14920 [Planctomycetaceae bacterium]|nr:hypothetical protein [Planctomycetaceae bacterium]
MNELATAYVDVKRKLIDDGFAGEIDWQESLSFGKISEREFIREAAWVILSAGMSERVIRRIFSKISDAFLNWESAALIRSSNSKCEKRALKVFGNRRKITAILKLTDRILLEGFETLRKKIEVGGVEYIRTLPFMGPATSQHLAKNIGINTAKADRHLSRIAKRANFSCPNDLCQYISNCVGDNVAVVDLVLWRFATITPNYLEYFPGRN